MLNLKGLEVSAASARVGSINQDSDQNKKRGMILPFTPLSITFDDIRYSVDMPEVKGSLQQP